MSFDTRIGYFFRLYRKAFGAYTPQAVFIIALAVVSSILEGLGISAIIPIFSFVGGGGGAATDTISQIIAGLFAFAHITYSFRVLLIFIATLFVVRTVILFLIQIITARIVYGYERDLRGSLFSGMMRANWPFLSKQHIGNLEQLLTTNTTNASQFFGNISASALVVSKILMYVLVAVNVSPWVAAFSLVAGALIFFVLKPIFYRTRMIAVENERTNRALSHFVGEHVIGMKALKVMALESPVIERANIFFDRVRTLNLRSIILRSNIGLIVQLGGVVFVGIVFAVMYRSAGFSIAAFGVIVYAMNQIFSQIQAGQVQLHSLTTLMPYIGETLSYLDKTREHQESRGGTKDFSINREIRFQDVSFSYPERGVVLDHVNVTIRKGELLGIVGPSGSGKTTFADQLLRLVEPSEGLILADDTDIRDISVSSWRLHVGYVAQDPVLLNDTIEQNIRFYNASLTRKDIEEAAKLAHIHHFIETLSDGYDTLVGDRGALLSGGQRQRVALARVLARKPELLVLDEATSSLDTESERAIQSAIESLHGEITVVVIAHRLSTVTSADRLVVLKGGKVTEEGTPQELLSRKDSYLSAALSTSGEIT